MIVVDSAAVVDALSPVAGTDALRARLATEDLHAPSLVDFEVVSALRGLTLGGHLGVARAEDPSPISTISPYSAGHQRMRCEGARSN